MYYTCFSVDAPDSYERLLHLMNLFEADGDILKIGFASLLRQSLHPDPEVRPCLIQLMRVSPFLPSIWAIIDLSDRITQTS